MLAAEEEKSPQVNITEVNRRGDTDGDLEADIVKMLDYHDNIILHLESPCKKNDPQKAGGARISLVM